MTSYDNFSKKSRNIKDGNYENFDKAESYDPANIEQINYETWAEFLSYYRYYIDEFAANVLLCNVFSFQRLILLILNSIPDFP